VKHCPNPECPYRKRHGRDAEYRDEATTCSDCGSPLATEESSPPGVGAIAPMPAASGPWRRLGVTVGCAAVCVLCMYTPLPGTEGLGLEPSKYRVQVPAVGLMAIGMRPIVIAYAMVELFAVLAPSWRPLRLNGVRGRRRLRRAVISLAAILAVIQALGITRYLQTLSRGLDWRHVPVDPWVPWLTLVALPLGTLLFAVMAAAIDRWGLGDGYSVLSLAWSVPEILHPIRLLPPAPDYPLLLSLLAAVVGMVVLATTRALNRQWPFAVEGEAFAFEIPPCGADPLTVGPALLALPASFAAFVPGLDGFDLRNLNSTAFESISLMLMASLGVGFCFLYNQPRRVGPVWFKAEPTEAQLGVVRLRLASSGVRGVALLLGVAFVLRRSPAGASSIGGAILLYGTAILLDLAQEWRFRRRHPGLVAVWPENRVYAVQPLLRALADARLPAFPRGLHHRTMLQFFGPYVPVTILVPSDKAGSAERIIRERLNLQN
jgi:hypothetical protein